ncbi:MAG: ProQ/FinO family protein [Ectothiorhodospiraceae bacterium]|nr:ProQ/FinO family protein [Ectothiorhodospiraceae bacterium]
MDSGKTANDETANGDQKRERARRTREFLDTLIQRYPDCFSKDPARILPLAIGIQKPLRSALAEDPELKDTPGWLVRQALALYTRSPAYLEATLKASHRIHLDGSQADAVTDQARTFARERREEQKKRAAARRKSRQAQQRQKPRRPSADELKQRKLEALARKFNSRN